MELIKKLSRVICREIYLKLVRAIESLHKGSECRPDVIRIQNHLPLAWIAAEIFSLRHLYTLSISK